MPYEYKQLIDGQWVAAANGGTWDLINPATEQVIRTLPFGDATDANAAIEAAARAFPAWRDMTPYERAAIIMKAVGMMRDRVEDLARTSTMECGKPLAQSRGEWGATADLFEWFAEEGKRAYGRVVPSRQATKRRLVIKQPLGVVGVITAWNFPSYNPGRAIAAALGAGCTVVARGSEYTPMTLMEMGNILQEAGLPAGVLNIINGDAPSQGAAMLAHPALRKIGFTGSTRVGRILLDGSSKTFTRLGLELGGNAPVIIMPDADLAAVAEGAVTAKLRNGGQVCVSPQRFLVHSTVMEEFVDLTQAAMQKIVIGNGLDDATQIGPMINAPQRERLEQLVADAVSGGGEIIQGGKRPAEFDAGYFYEPTLIANVDTANRLYREEIFGPVMPVIPFAEVEEAIALGNDTEYGLASYAFTNDLNTAIKLYEGLEFGMVGINEWYPQTTEVPFPGWKQSGIGMEAGMEGLQDYLETKVVAFGGL